MAFETEAKEVYNISLKAEEGINLFQPPPVMIFNNILNADSNFSREISIGASFNSAVTSTSEVEVVFGQGVTFNSSGTSDTNIESGVGSFAQVIFGSTVESTDQIRFGSGQGREFESEGISQSNFDLILDPTLTFNSSTVSSIALLRQNVAPNVVEPDLSVPEVTPYSFTVSYTHADDETPESNLTYHLYLSDSDNLDTDVSTVETNGTLKNSGTGVTELVADNLEQNTEYYFNVVVEDSDGEKSIYNSEAQTTHAEQDFQLETFTVV